MDKNLKVNYNPTPGWVEKLKPGDLVYDCWGEKARGKSGIIYEIKCVSNAPDDQGCYYRVYFRNIPKEAVWFSGDYDYYVVNCDGFYGTSLDILPVKKAIPDDAGDGE